MLVQNMLILKHLKKVLETMQTLIIILNIMVKVQDHQTDLATIQEEQILKVDLLVITLDTTMNSWNH